MAGKVETYRSILAGLSNWDDYLRRESGLPGPRGNLELAAAVAAEGNVTLFNRWAALDARQAPVGSQDEFLAFCGVLGWGRMLAEGRAGYLPRLRRAASDSRWRIREAVAMALQTYGAADMQALLRDVEGWARGNPYERRAVVAGLCEPRLLRNPTHIRRVLRILDRVTSSVLEESDRASDGFRALRKGLGYCWSVAVTALPQAGQPAMEKWFVCEDRDIQWMMRENLKKARLVRVDPAWVAKWKRKLAVA